MTPGDLVAERFEIERIAGAGGMGVVYRAYDRASGEIVALKILQPGSGQELRFAREARVLASLRHPAIVRYVDHGEVEPGTSYLAMAWLEGGDLAARLRRVGPGLSLFESLDLVARVADALGTAHALGVVHRDVKPNNLILPDGAVERATVIDFGIARGGHHLTAMPTLTVGPIGTPGYMSPEQARGGPAIDARTDVFALGCVLFECVTGRRAFEGEHAIAVLAKILLEDPPRPSDVRPALPPEIDELVLAMLAKDPAARPADGHDVASRVREVRARLVDATAPNARPTPAAPTEALTGSERHRVSIVLAAARSSADADTIADQQSRSALAALAAVVAPFGATLEVLLGGTLVVALTAVEIATDQAARAARTALALAPHMPGTPLFVATGHATLASRAPVGEVVDRALGLARAWSEVEQAGPPPICVDDVTAGLLDAGFELERDVRGPGLLLRRERRAHDARRTLLGKPTSCVGRERELAMLLALADEAFAEPMSRVAIVTAPAGVGKSRIGSELAARVSATHPGLELWIARGDPARVGAPYGLVSSAIRRAAGLADGEPAEPRLAKLAAHLGRVVQGDDAERLEEFLGELLGLTREQPSARLRAARLAPALMADQIRRAFVDFVLAECRRGPLLVVLDDIQFGDRPSLDLVDAALAAAHEAPLLVLALARPEAHDAFPGLFAAREVQEVRLGRIVKRSAEALVREVLGPSVSDTVVARIVERADGHAFYLEELIRAVAEGKGDAFPETVVAMVEARLDLLAFDARRVLRAASVFGDVFWEDGVRALLGTEHAFGASEWMQILIEGEYVTPRNEPRFAGQRELAFRHGLVREAAYARLTDADRALGHRLAATWLQGQGETDGRVLAAHHASGDRPALAVPHWVRAAEQALDANDLVGAIACAERGVAQGATGEARGILALVASEAHRMRGAWELAEKASIEAFEATPARSPRAPQVAAELATAHGPRAGRERMIEAARALVEMPEADRDAPEFLAAVARVATQLWQVSAHEAAEALLDRTHATERASGSTELVVSIAFARLAAFAALNRGDVAGWGRENARCAEYADQAGDRRNACISRANVGHAMMQLGRYEDAVQILRAAIQVARAMGIAHVVAVAEGNLGLALAGVGESAEAGAIFTRVLGTYRAQGNRRSIGLAAARLAIVALAASDAPLARAYAEEARETLAEIPSLEAYALAIVARVELAVGDTAAALQLARNAADRIATTGTIEEGEAWVHLTLAEALLAYGDDDAAQAAAERAAMRLRERAGKIDDLASRASFLERVPEHRRTIELADHLRAARAATSS